MAHQSFYGYAFETGIKRNAEITTMVSMSNVVVVSPCRLKICLHYLDSGGLEAKRHQIRGIRGADGISGYIRVGQ